MPAKIKTQFKNLIITGIIALSVLPYALPGYGFFGVNMVAQAAAGVPEIVSYQGRLTDSLGNLLGGSGTDYYFKFSIWDNETVGNGTKLWPAGAPGTTTLQVEQGVFNVNIGDTANGYPDALTYDFQTNDTVYLQVQVSANIGGPFETLAPRQQITSAGYAINAGSVQGSVPGTGAGNILLLDGSGNIDIAGDVITGGALQGGSLDVAGSIQAGSGNITITTAAGNIDADAIGFITGDGSGATSSGSGLETDTDRLGLLQGCANNQILKWNDGSSVWACAADNAGGGAGTLQDAYDNGSSITTTDSKDIDLVLADTTSDSNLDIDLIADNTVSISRNDGASTEAPSQLLSIENLDTNLTIAAGISFNVATGGVLTTGIDLSDADIVTALAVGSNDVTVGGATISAAEFAILDNNIALTSEVTGILPTANGGTGLNTSGATNGQLLIGNGSGLSLATLTQGTGITVTNGSGSITIASTLGTSVDLTAEVAGTLPVGNGGTGAASFTTGGILIGGATISDTGVLTNGQLLIGDGSGAPTLATLTQGSGITVSNGAGSITVAATLGTDIDSSEIVDNTITASDLGATLTFADGDFLNMSAINTSSTTEGLILPQAASCASGTAEGQICWDTDGDFLSVGNGTTATTLLTAGGTLFTAAGTSGSSQTILQGDTLTIAAGAGITTTGGATDTITIAATLGTSVDLAAEVTGTLPVGNGGTGAASFTTGGIILGGATLTDTGVLTNGQLLIGDGSGAPAVATLTQGTGITISNGAGSITITNSDLGSAQNIFKNFAVATQNTIVADANSDTFTFANGAGITITTNDTTDTLTITSTLGASVDLTSEVTGVLPDANVADNITISSSGSVDWTALTNYPSACSAGQAVTALGDVPTCSAFDTSTTNELQNLFETIAVSGQNNVVADSNTDTLTLAAGSNITITTNNTTDTITISAASGSVYDNISVNGSAATDANFIDVTAAGSTAGTTWSLNTGATPDEITLAISNASASVAGVVTTGTQTFAGAKTLTSNATVQKADPALIFDVSTATDTDFWLGVTDDGGTDDDDLFQIGDGVTPGSNAFLTINTTGNIGVGTATNLVQKLNVNGTVGTTSEGDIFSQYDNSSTTWYPIIARYWDTSASAFDGGTYIFGNGANAYVGIEVPGGGNVNLFQVRADATTFNGTVSIASLGATDSSDILCLNSSSEVAGCDPLTDAQVSNTLTASNFVGSGSTTNAVDLATAEINGTLPVGNGGTGATTFTTGGILLGNGTSAVQATGVLTNGQLLIGDGSGAPTVATLTQGTGITVTNGAGSITIDNAGVTAIAGTANQITASASTGSVILSVPSDFRAPGTLNAVTSIATGAGAGTVRIDASGNLTNIGNITSGSAATYGTSSGDLTLAANGSSTGNVIIGGAASTTPDLLVVGRKSDAGNPSAVDGAIYYNDNSDKFFIAENGSWKEICNKTDAACGAGSGSAWSAISNPAGNLSLSMAEYTTSFGWDTAATAATADYFSLTVTNDATTDSNAQRLLVLQNNDSTGSTATERLLVLNNADTDEVVTTALEIASAAGAITTAIDASDSDIVTALNVGANDIVGTTGLINYTNFDVDASGNVIGAAITGSSFVRGSDTITDFTGTGLQMNSGALETTLGTSIDLTSEVTGILPVANGGTGANTLTTGGILLGNGTSAITATAVLANGELLIGDGSGAPTVATLTQGTGITITNGAGSITIASVLGTAIDSSEITDNTVTATDLAATLTFADGDLLDLSAINTSSGTEGLILPQAASCTSGTAEGQICWDTDGDFISVGNGTTATSILTGGTALFTLAGTSGSSQTITAGDTVTIAAGAGITTTGGATDTVTIASTLGTSVDLTSEVTGILPVANGGTGANTLTTGGILLGNGTSAITATAVLANGELLIGDGSGAPTIATLTQGTGITITNGAGSITVTSTLGTAIDSSEITDNTVTASDLAATLTFADGDLVDLSAINTSSATEGLILPQATSCTSGTAEGQICWDTDGDFLSIGNGTTTTSILTAGGTLFTAAGTSGSSQTISQGDTLTIAAGAGITTTGGATDTITIAATLGTSIDLTAEVTGILPVANGGTGANTLTTGGILLGNGTSAITATAVLANGELLIGDGSGAPTIATLTQGTGITISNGAGSITVTSTLGTAIDSSEITDNTVTATDLAATLTFADGDLVDLSAINTSSATEGLLLPQAASCASGTAEGQICWDTDGDFISVGNGTTATAILTGGTTLFTLAGTSGSSQTITAGDTVTIAAGAGITTTGGATDTVTIASTLGTSVDLTTEVTGTLPVGNGGTGATTLNNLIALTTHTTGNYVASITNGTGITGGDGGSEGAALTLSINQATNFAWTGIHSWTNTLTATSSQTDFNLTLGDDGDADTISAVNIDVTSANTGDADIVYGINIANLSSADGTVLERALRIGSGWDQAIDANGTLISLAELQVLDGGIDLTSEVTGALPVGNGGTGAATFTTGGILLGNGTSAVQVTGVLANGELLIGDGSGAPTVTTLTQGAGITVTNGAGSITIAATLGTAIDSSEITDDTITASDLAATLTFADGDFINLSAINTSSTTEGLILPQAASCASGTAEGQICWDTDGDFLSVGNGTTATSILTGGTTLFTLAGTSGSSQTITAGDTVTIAAGTGITTTGGATDTVTIVATLGTAIDTSEITNNTILPLDLDYGADTPGDEECLTYESTGSIFEWQTCAGAGGDSISVNSSAATDANFLDVAASGSVAGTAWTLNAASSPDDITLAISNASGSVAGVVTTGSQTFAGAKTLTSNLTVNKADPSLVFDVSTATDTDFWLGVTDDGGTDDDDLFQIGDGTTPGTNPFLTINTSGVVGINRTAPVSSEKLVIGTNGSSYGWMQTDGTTQLGSYIDGSAGWIGTNSNHALNLFTNNSGTPTVIVSTAGNVTIRKSAAPTSITKANTYLMVGGAEFATNSYRLIGFGWQGGTHTPAYIGYQETDASNNTSGELIFATRNVTTDTAPTERMRITAAGNITIGAGASIAPSSAGGLTFGSASATALTFTTDGTGDAEIVLPAGSISGTEILDDTVALTTDTSGNYVASVANGTGITGGSAGSEGATLTLSVDQSTNFAWTGIHSWTNTLTATSSQTDFNLTLGNDGDADTISAVNIDVTSANTGDADIVYGINIANLSSADGTVLERALRIGSGWDQAIDANGTLISLAELQALDGGIDLTSEVTGTLPVGNGGTGATSLNNLITLATHTTGNYVATIADSGASTISVTGSGSENAAVTLGIVADSIGDTQLAFNTGQHLTTTSNVQFATATLDNAGLHLLDTNASHDLIIAPGSNITADRTLTITTGDADRTLTLTGNASITGTNTGDQSLFLNVAVSGQNTIVADATTDTLTVVAGSGITITTDDTTDAITITSALGTAIDTTEITNGTILPTDLNIGADTPSDEECLTYESTGTVFEWQTCGGGGGASDINGLSDALADYTDHNMRLGSNTALTASATGNLFIGDTAGTAGTANSDNNIAIGYLSLSSLTDGSSNIAIGVESMRDNTTGVSNVAIGALALVNNETGGTNTIVGYGAAATATDRSSISAFGAFALGANTGDGNSAFGAYSLTDNQGGANNTAIGLSSMESNTSGNFNTALGIYSLFTNDTGGQNVAIGASALETTTGSNNIALGFQAGNALTTGSNNIIIGYDIDVPSDTGSNQLNIGNTIYGTLNNTRIGIGDFSADTIDSALHIVGAGSAIRLDDAAGNDAGCIRYNDTSNELEFANDCSTYVAFGSGGGGGDSISVNSSAAADANFLNVTATGSVAGTTWSLNAGSTPDDITLAISNASASVAGVVTTGTQTFAGDKTFTSDITIQKAQPAVVFDAGTGSDTNFWMGVMDDNGNDNDDLFKIGEGITPDSGAILSIDVFGRVAIGGNPTSSKLSVFTDGSDSAGILVGATDSGNAYVCIDASNGDCGGDDYLRIQQSDDLSSTITHNGGVLNFNNGTSNAVVFDTAGNVGIGDTTPDYRLELHDATNTPIFAMSDDDITHGLTTLAQTDVFANISSISTTAGGAQITGVSDTDAQAMLIQAIMGSTNPTDTTAAIKIVGAKSNGTTGMADLGAAETVFQVANNDDAAAMTILGNGSVGIGATSSLKTKLHVTGTVTTSGADAIATIFTDNTLNNSTGSGFQFGLRHLNSITSSTAGTHVGEFIRMTDNTSLSTGQVVRGIEVQAYSGSNNNGINTGVAAFGKTFGIHGETTAQAGSVSQPAAVFADLNNSSDGSLGNAIRAYSNDATSANMVSIFHETSTMSGTGLIMNMAAGSGSFTGNFADFQKNSVSKFTVDDTGRLDVKIADADNTIAIYINTEESTDTQSVFAIESDVTANSQSADAVKAHFEADGSLFVSLTGGQTTVALCHTTNGQTNNDEIVDCSGAPTDLAEYFGSVDPSLAPAELVVSDGESSTLNIDGYHTSKAWVKRSSKPYEGTLIGVVSTAPSEVYGDEVFQPQDHAKPIALAGRVPVKVNLQNGPIKAGDYLTSSSVPGVAMKSTKPGVVIGQALSSYDGTQGQASVVVFVGTFYHDPTTLVSEDGSVTLQRGGATTTLIADSSNAAMLINQKGSGDLLQAQSNGINRFAIQNTGAVNINALTVDEEEKIVVVESTDGEAFSINSRGDVALAGVIVVKDDTFAGSIATNGNGEAEIDFTYDLGTGKPVVQLTPESESPVFAQVVEWKKDAEQNYIGFKIKTFSLGGQIASAIVHYNVTAKQADYETNGDVVYIPVVESPTPAPQQQSNSTPPADEQGGDEGEVAGTETLQPEEVSEEPANQPEVPTPTPSPAPTPAPLPTPAPQPSPAPVVSKE